VNAKNEVEALFWRLAPPVAAVLLTMLFVSLGFWQLDRAAEKVAMQRLFDTGEGYTPVSHEMFSRDYQRISASGTYLGDRQFLIDNMIMNGRLGYFVITPFEYASDKPLLMVNRGWISATPDRSLPLLMPPSVENTEIFGRAGHLPRVAIRSGNAVANAPGWPKLATYPELSDLSQALGRDLLPFILLLDPHDGDALIREWQPQGRGPAMHYGYAFQWFAMAATVLAISIWQFLKKRRSRDRA
jgi:surfeit locus 1 family protein